ncbi:MAG TPA: TraR/DksA C4-type zinc finger protein [Planctomycetaceae bacterium]|jgi:RNA polymerase-binding transcription factor DksA|nr:TraR/DksA C4-type zinc finger protein [Planctomycetaceae bacterium]
MIKRSLEGYRRRLKQLAERMQNDASAVIEQVREPSGGQAAGDLSNAPMHLGDMGTEEFLQDINATLMENEEYLVNEAREALRRIDDGTFGRCEECGQEIPRERLDALPYARFCTRCAEAVGLGSSLTRPTRRVEPMANWPSPADPNVVPPQRIQEIEADEEPVFGKLDRDPVHQQSVDIHAAGTPGGGTAVGGLAGSNGSYGEPEIEELDEAMASGLFDREGPIDEPEETPKAGPAGGAVGGTPANKRAVGD